MNDLLQQSSQAEDKMPQNRLRFCRGLPDHLHPPENHSVQRAIPTSTVANGAAKTISPITVPALCIYWPLIKMGED